MAEHYISSGEIDSGTVLIGGVVREIESGTVLIGGVVREIEFTPPVNLITFTVDTAMDGVKTYTAEEGMTWGEFIDSSYNDGTFHISYNGRNEVTGNLFDIWEGFEIVHAYDIITPNGEYQEV